MAYHQKLVSHSPSFSVDKNNMPVLNHRVQQKNAIHSGLNTPTSQNALHTVSANKGCSETDPVSKANLP